jgi:hypothetical protein
VSNSQPTWRDRDSQNRLDDVGIVRIQTLKVKGIKAGKFPLRFGLSPVLNSSSWLCTNIPQILCVLHRIQNCFAGPAFSPSATTLLRYGFTGRGKISKVSFRGRGSPEEFAFFSWIGEKADPSLRSG